MCHKLMVLAMAALGGILVAASGENSATVRPKAGFVPTKDVAVTIAVAVWEPIYGPERIAAEKPYQTRLTNGVWIIQGSMPNQSVRGVAEAHISKEDGRIISVGHGR